MSNLPCTEAFRDGLHDVRDREARPAHGTGLVRKPVPFEHWSGADRTMYPAEVATAVLVRGFGDRSRPSPSLRPDVRPAYMVGMVETVAITDLPQLANLCWNRDVSIPLRGDDALALYEREWRHVDEAAMSIPEREALDRLVRLFGNGVFMPAGAPIRVVE